MTVGQSTKHTTNYSLVLSLPRGLLHRFSLPLNYSVHPGNCLKSERFPQRLQVKTAYVEHVLELVICVREAAISEGILGRLRQIVIRGDHLFHLLLHI